MAKYVYMEAKELYNKLKTYLKMNIKFGTHIRSQYFCIYAKSRVLALKAKNTWYINLDNWGITDKELLPRLGITSLTPGSHALKEFKTAMLENQMFYDNVWPPLSNEINKIIKTGYNAGLLYARPGIYNQKVWHYDLNAAFAYAFANADVPVGIPKVVEGYLPPDDEHLNIYLMDMNVEYKSTHIFPYLVNSSDIHKLPSQIIDGTGYHSLYKVITQTEYLDVIKDYDVISECIYTIRFKKSRSIFKPWIQQMYIRREESEGEERVVWKSILASLAGKLAQAIDQQQVPLKLNDFETVVYETLAIPDKEINYINPAVSLFIIDYVRKMVRDTIRKIGYQNVVMVDTDGFISLKELDIPHSIKLGEWKLKCYDNLIVNGKRSYFYTHNGEFHSSISGLGDIYDDGLNQYNFEEVVNITKLKSHIPIVKKVLYSGEDRYITMKVNVGGKK